MLLQFLVLSDLHNLYHSYKHLIENIEHFVTEKLRIIDNNWSIQFDSTNLNFIFKKEL